MDFRLWIFGVQIDWFVSVVNWPPVGVSRWRRRWSARSCGFCSSCSPASSAECPAGACRSVCLSRGHCSPPLSASELFPPHKSSHINSHRLTNDPPLPSSNRFSIYGLIRPLLPPPKSPLVLFYKEVVQALCFLYGANIHKIWGMNAKFARREEIFGKIKFW